MTKLKIIVLDDDPTGSQTVHSCLLLMDWAVETLEIGLQDASPILFILTNTRAMTPDAAAATTRAVCQNLNRAMIQLRSQSMANAEPTDGALTDVLVVSRSDSTLRGHYPIETDVIAAELGPFDAHFLVPAFFEGGRTTRNSIHYLNVNGVDTPVHETEFARDSVFAYHHSYLPDYVEEKTQGKILASQVERFTVDQIRDGVQDRLLQLQDNCCCVVDGETQADLNKFAADVLAAASQGKRFLFRSAASILTALAALPPQPISADHMAEYVRQAKPGAVIVGSHVQKTTEQLHHLLQAPDIVGVELDVAQLVEAPPDRIEQLVQATLAQVHQIHAAGQTPVVYTSRQELSFASVALRMQFGATVSEFLMAIVRQLPDDIGFLISKGGITSNDTLSQGLALKTARLLGQIIPGVSMVRTGADHPRFPHLPVVLFPGNVGDAQALATAYLRLRP